MDIEKLRAGLALLPELKAKYSEVLETSKMASIGFELKVIIAALEASAAIPVDRSAVLEAIEAYTPFPNQKGSVFRGMYEKVAKPELLSIVRALSAPVAAFREGMVEKVARAMCVADDDIPDELQTLLEGTQAVPHWQAYTDLARAAINAMLPAHDPAE